MGANTQYTKRQIVGSPKAWGSVVLISQCQAPPGRLISDRDPISDGPMPDPHKYLVKWLGWNAAHNEWFDVDDLPDAKDLVRDYDESHPEDDRPYRPARRGPWAGLECEPIVIPRQLLDPRQGTYTQDKELRHALRDHHQGPLRMGDKGRDDRTLRGTIMNGWPKQWTDKGVYPIR